MKVVLTPTAAEHFRQALQYTKQKHGLAQMKKYAALLKKGLAAIPEHHSYAAKQSEGLELQLIEHHYAAYKVLTDGTFAIAALLWEGRDIPERLKELNSMTAQEISALQKQIH